MSGPFFVLFCKAESLGYMFSSPFYMDFDYVFEI